MRNFDVEKYLEAGKQVYGKRSLIEKMADEITERGYDSLVILGIGGTWAEWNPVVHVMKQFTDMPIYLENAAEFLVKRNKRYLNESSLVVTASVSGDTKEILEAVKMCKTMGIEVAGFSKDENTPLAKELNYLVTQPSGQCEYSYLVFFLFGLRLLFKRDEYPLYEEFADQMACLHENLVRIRKDFEPRAAEIARMYAKEPYSVFVGSGTLWGEVFLFTMCILEEMQWVRTRAVTSADFFHGTLELVDKDVPVFLFKGEDEYRELDDRVERFIRKYKVTDKFTVIDIRDYKLEGIGDEFRVICSPMILTALVSERLAAHYELNTGHSLQFRRYYRQLEY